MAIHSLYYLEPKDVCKLVQKAPMVALVHTFKSHTQYFGTIPGQSYHEAKSVLLPGGLVTMFNQDEFASYTHSNLGWLHA
jgi:hypothetical protein